MTITLKNFIYGSIGFWTLLSILEIWDVISVGSRMLMTLSVLTFAGIITLWVNKK